MLNQISSYGWPHDFVRQQEKIVREMTVERIRELARQYADPSRMIWLIVGDAKTQMKEIGRFKAGD